MTTSMKDIFERFWAHITNKIDSLTYNWNDLEDKPFYETNEVISVILEEQTFEVHPGGTGSNYNVRRAIKTVGYNITELLVNGETYKVTLNGVEYICTAYRGGFGLVLGEYDTTDLVHRETLNYPFSFSTTLDVIDDIVVDDTITVKIEHGNFGVKQLDEKFIPDTIARVEDIPEGFSGSWNDLTDRPFYNERVYYVANGFFECFDQMDKPYDGFYHDRSQEFKVYKLLKEGQEYIVAYEDADGRYKENTYIGTDVGGNIAIGNLSFYDESYPDTGEPFIIFYLVNHEWGFVGTKEPGEVELYEFSTIEVKLLDEEVIPDTIVRQSALEAYETEIVDKVLSALPTWDGGSY